VAIWTIRLAPGAQWTLPAARAGSNRMLYFFQGDSLRLGDETQREHAAIQVRAEADIPLQAGAEETELLLLQGRPIGEPVAQHGPFVMNSREEILQAFADYQQTEFGGWPWPSDGPVHEKARGRHARHPDGRAEQMT
jgi:hypothetical protein